MKDLKVVLANPRGFCAGVERAIEIVEKALEKFGPPVYVHHEIVHNQYVVNSLKARGVIFVNEISDIPQDAITIFSAHGVSDKVEENAAEHRLKVLDATCPLVTKVHLAAQKYEKDNKKIIIIGHHGHPEVIGTIGKVKQQVDIVSSEGDVRNLNYNNDENLAYVTQTTLSVNDTAKIITALKDKFPNIIGPDTKDICYATQNRQQAVKLLSKKVDLILVLGSKNSSNSNRLKDLGEEMQIFSYLIDNYTEIDLHWFENANSVGITAGASAPELLVQNTIKFLSSNFNIVLEDLEGITESVKFKLPKILYS